MLLMKREAVTLLLQGAGPLAGLALEHGGVMNNRSAPAGALTDHTHAQAEGANEIVYKSLKFGERMPDTCVEYRHVPNKRSAARGHVVVAAASTLKKTCKNNSIPARIWYRIGGLV